MSAYAFNPLKAARAFKDAGADEQLAEAVAGAICDSANAVEGKLATKTDLGALEHLTRSSVAELEQRMIAFEQRMKANLYRTLWLQTGAIIAAVTAVTKLLP